jgi:ABC-type lipoprotein release transport system permease subunit
MRPLLAQDMSLQDVPTFAVALGSIVVSSMIAALIPARRVLALPPSIAMRDAG